MGRGTKLVSASIPGGSGGGCNIILCPHKLLGACPDGHDKLLYRQADKHRKKSRLVM